MAASAFLKALKGGKPDTPAPPKQESKPKKQRPASRKLEPAPPEVKPAPQPEKPPVQTIKTILKTPEALEAAARSLGQDPKRITGIEVDTGVERKKQSTRLIKALCAPCDWSFRITLKQASRGLPDCPLCQGKIKLEVK